MDNKFSAENPLGFAVCISDRRIIRYLSWREVYELVSSGKCFTATDGITYAFPLIGKPKEELPLISCKGDFKKYQSNANFTGERSPYIILDFDLDEKASGIVKEKATDAQKLLIDADFEMILQRLTDGKMKFFFLKRSHSGCGRHLVIKLDGAEPGKMALYEDALMSAAQGRIDAMTDLSYNYKVDTMLKVLSQGLHLNHDPDAIYNPDYSTPASLIELPDYHADYSGTTNQTPQRAANNIDRDLFARLGAFCGRKKIRLSYGDIFRIGLIWHCIYTKGTCDEFVTAMLGYNEARSRERGNSEKFLRQLYTDLKKSNASYKGKRVTIDSLYYYLEQLEYDPCDQVLHFNGYLQSVRRELYDAFNGHPVILFKAQTGAGKSREMFFYIKALARLNPHRQYVFALPYKTMVEQFALENSDDEFAIQVLHGDVNSLPCFIKQEPARPNLKPVQVLPDDVVPEMVITDTPSLIECVEREEERSRRLMKSRALMRGRKKKGKVVPATVQRPLFDDPKPKLNNIWCATYDSARQVKHLHVLVVDECHDMIKQYGFRPDAVNALDGINAEKIIYATATPDWLMPEIFGAYFIDCVKDDKPKPDLIVEQVTGGALDSLKQKIRGSRSSLSFLNNKRHCKQLQEELGEDGIDLSVYTSDERRGGHFTVLYEKRVIATHSIATCILWEALNIENLDIEIINIVNECDIDNIVQASARPRKCLPRINLIYSNPFWERNKKITPKLKIYQAKMSYYQGIADRLNRLIDEGKAIDVDANKFSDLDSDYSYIIFDNRSKSYRADEFKVKYLVNVMYADLLYNQSYDNWLKKLRLHFNVTEVQTKNDTVDPDTGLDFQLFKNAGDDVIMAFHQFEKSKKGNRNLRMPKELLEWSEKNNAIQWQHDFKRWTQRYVFMKGAGNVDWDTIKSDVKYSYWKRRHDFTQSIIQGASSAKDVAVKNRSEAIVNFIAKQDTSNAALNSDALFAKLNERLTASGYKPEQNQKLFFNKISSVLGIKIKQKKDGTRYIAEIVDKRPELMPEQIDLQIFDKL